MRTADTTKATEHNWEVVYQTNYSVLIICRMCKVMIIKQADHGKWIIRFQTVTPTDRLVVLDVPKFPELPGKKYKLNKKEITEFGKFRKLLEEKKGRGKNTTGIVSNSFDSGV